MGSCLKKIQFSNEPYQIVPPSAIHGEKIDQSTHFGRVMINYIVWFPLTLAFTWSFHMVGLHVMNTKYYLPYRFSPEGPFSYIEMPLIFNFYLSMVWMYTLIYYFYVSATSNFYQKIMACQSWTTRSLMKIEDTNPLGYLGRVWVNFFGVFFSVLIISHIWLDPTIEDGSLWDLLTVKGYMGFVAYECVGMFLADFGLWAPHRWVHEPWMYKHTHWIHHKMPYGEFHWFVSFLAFAGVGSFPILFLYHTGLMKYVAINRFRIAYQTFYGFRGTIEGHIGVNNTVLCIIPGSMPLIGYFARKVLKFNILGQAPHISHHIFQKKMFGAYMMWDTIMGTDHQIEYQWNPDKNKCIYHKNGLIEWGTQSERAQKISRQSFNFAVTEDHCPGRVSVSVGATRKSIRRMSMGLSKFGDDGKENQDGIDPRLLR